MLQDWNETARAPIPRLPISSPLSRRRSELGPDAAAVRCGSISLGYRELNRRVNKAAHGLIARGVGPETIVAVIDERGVDYLVMMLAALKAGGVYLPLDPRHPRLRHLRHHRGERRSLGAPGKAWLQEFRERCRGGAAKVVVIVRTRASDRRMQPPLRASPRNLAYIIHTSGSTGTPKGAMVDRGGMFNNLMTKIPALNLGRSDVIAQTASQAFDISVWQFLTALLCGACVDILPDAVAQDPRALLGALHERDITILESVPTMIRAVLEASPGDAPLRLRWLLPTGEALPPDLCRAWFARYPKHTNAECIRSRRMRR